MAQIAAADFNAIRSKVISVIGSGSGPLGYGQAIQSSAITPGTVISATQYDDLRFDIVNIKIHQDGVSPFIRDINKGDVIRSQAGDPKIQYDNLANICIQNKFNISTGQYALNARTSQTRGTAWSTQVSCVVTVTFANANDARYFFNSGGKIRFTSTRTGGAATNQNSSWTNLLTTAGTQSFGAVNDSPLVNYYSLTNAYQQFYIKLASSSYASNNYTIEAKCDVASNSGGTARIIDFRIKWTDAYVDPDTLNPLPSHPSFAPTDTVDGSLTLAVEELKATGALLPYGAFTITSPTYSITSISGS